MTKIRRDFCLVTLSFCYLNSCKKKHKNNSKINETNLLYTLISYYCYLTKDNEMRQFIHQQMIFIFFLRIFYVFFSLVDFF